MYPNVMTASVVFHTKKQVLNQGEAAVPTNLHNLDMNERLGWRKQSGNQGRSGNSHYMSLLVTTVKKIKRQLKKPSVNFLAPLFKPYKMALFINAIL